MGRSRPSQPSAMFMSAFPQNVVGCSINVPSPAMSCPFHVLSLSQRQDMLLGQDWLVKEKAILNCGKNEITLTRPGLVLNPVHADTPCMDMGDDELITPLQAKRLVERGAQAFTIN
eukprot:181862-Chlamydomonas_euryale.AAC.1